jgi:phosphoribosylformylglycinamidine cyclo-ligase
VTILVNKVYSPEKFFGEKIREIIEETHIKPGTKAAREISVKRIGKRYSITEYSEPLRSSEKMTVTDGTGTKGYLIWALKKFSESGSNPFAMTVDDLYEHNFQPYKIQSHLILQEENLAAILESISSLKSLCVKYKWKTPAGVMIPIIIDGGETAICNTIGGMEFSVTATGYADPKDVLVPHAGEGDTLIGISSNGIHSNGLTFVREKILPRKGLDYELDSNSTLGTELVKPTRIYIEALRELNKSFRKEITGKVHITGGGFSKLRELSKKTVSYEVFKEHGLVPQKIFQFIYDESHMNDTEMLSRFNCGIGYVVSIKGDVARDAVKILNKYYSSDIIGKVKAGNPVIRIESPFSKNVVKL